MFEFTEQMRPYSWLWQRIQREIEKESLNQRHKFVSHGPWDPVEEVGPTSFAFPVTKGKIQFDRSQKLGEGGCGTVFEGTFNATTPVAVKRVEKVRSRNNTAADSLLQKLDHANIIKLFHAEQDEDFEYYTAFI